MENEDHADITNIIIFFTNGHHPHYSSMGRRAPCLHLAFELTEDMSDEEEGDELMDEEDEELPGEQERESTEEEEHADEVKGMDAELEPSCGPEEEDLAWNRVSDPVGETGGEVRVVLEPRPEGTILLPAL